ncbi:MAG TPA: hypothetical protein VGW34_00660 [Allosphingosinicella sp.]|nr:hypothetical protein [Allosphingosinicella sp.]
MSGLSAAEGGELGIQDFSGSVGEAFEVATVAGLRLVLEGVEPLGHSPRPGGAFSLLFRGPADPVLPQAIYELSGGGESHEIFIVPIARDSAGTQYQAIFN